MIVTHVKNNNSRNDNYKRLALYIVDANKKGSEKVLYAWHDGSTCEDYHEAILEATLTQNMNSRSQKEKTYHLVVSFRPEDEMVLTEKIFKEIEQHFSKVLGFDVHQRHCGVHVNTDNIHMHIAFNMINSKTYNRLEPYRDFFKLSQTARELEKKYNLAIDVGPKNEDGEKNKVNRQASGLEKVQGLESFDSYIKNRKEPILQKLEKAQSWEDIYKTLAIYGVSITPMGNGLVIKDKYSKHSIKASSLDRKFSKNNLEKLLGKYEADKTPPETLEEKERYTKKPIQKQSPERDALFKQYQALTTKRKVQYDAIDKTYKEQEEKIKNRWAKERFMLNQVALLKRDRSEALKINRLKEKEAIAQLKASINSQKTEVKAQNPSSWNKFLIMEAGRGNETALEVLRYKNLDIEESENTNETLKRQNQEHIKSAYRQKQIDIFSNSTITGNAKKGLTAILKMEEMQELSGDIKLTGMTSTIDHKGIVIFNLTGGGNIRDTGREIHYSNHNLKAKEIAEQYVKHRWGENFYIDKNKFVFNLNEKKTEKQIKNLEKERQNKQQKMQEISR